jgi:hypothetical protein
VSRALVLDSEALAALGGRASKKQEEVRAAMRAAAVLQRDVVVQPLPLSRALGPEPAVVEFGVEDRQASAIGAFTGHWNDHPHRSAGPRTPTRSSPASSTPRLKQTRLHASLGF